MWKCIVQTDRQARSDSIAWRKFFKFWIPKATHTYTPHKHTHTTQTHTLGKTHEKDAIDVSISLFENIINTMTILS